MNEHIDIEALARLSQIALTDEEKHALAADVGAILAFGRVLVETAGADTAPEAFSDVVSAAHGASTRRADEPLPSLSREELLALAPSSADGYVTVPHVLSDGGEGGNRT